MPPARAFDGPDVVGPGADRRTKAVGRVAEADTGGQRDAGTQRDAGAHEDGEESAHSARGIGQGVGAGEGVEQLHVQYGVEAGPGREGAHGFVLTHRRTVGRPLVADRPAKPRGERAGAVVDVPPQDEDGPGGTDAERGGPAGGNAVGRFVVLQPGPSLRKNHHGPLTTGRDEQHALTRQWGDRFTGIRFRAAERQGTGHPGGGRVGCLRLRKGWSQIRPV